MTWKELHNNPSKNNKSYKIVKAKSSSLFKRIRVMNIQ